MDAELKLTYAISVSINRNEFEEEIPDYIISYILKKPTSCTIHIETIFP